MPYAHGIGSQQLKYVHTRMSDMAYPFVTPVCREVAADTGESFGTANFISFREWPYLITNDHVRRQGEGYRLAHFVGRNLEVVPITFPFRGKPDPIDVAMARIETDALAGGDKKILAASVLDGTFSPVAGEIMFVLGYPSDWGKFASTLRAGAMPLTVDILDLPFAHDLDPENHVSVRYPVAANRPEGDAGFLPSPEGLSGSFLWDTKFVAHGGMDWNPDMAKVAGLIFGYRDARLLALKIEKVREFILDSLRHETAYYRSLETQDNPAGPLSDWLWAEGLVQTID